MAGAVFSFNIDLRANTAGMTRGFGKAQGILRGFDGSVRSLSTGLAQFGAIGAGAGAAVLALSSGFSAAGNAIGSLVRGLGNLTTTSVGNAAAFEQQQVSLTTMLGSLENANELLGQLNVFAAETPFEFPELAQAAKSLIAFGVAQDNVIPTMRMLGDIASGLDIPFTEIADLYGKMRVQGRLFAEDINQLTGRGIPIIGELAKQFSVPETAIRKLVETGQVEFKHLEQAFISLTGAGGRFANLMAKQSQTVKGLWSTLRDNLNLTLTGIGQDIIAAFDLRGAISELTAWAAEMRNAFKSGFGTALQEVASLASELALIKLTARDFSAILTQGFITIADAAYEARLTILSMKAVLGSPGAALDLFNAKQEGRPGFRIMEDLKKFREEAGTGLVADAAKQGPLIGQSIGSGLFDSLLNGGMAIAQSVLGTVAQETAKFTTDRPDAFAARTTEAFSAALRNLANASERKGAKDPSKLMQEEIVATREVRDAVNRMANRPIIKEAIV